MKHIIALVLLVLGANVVGAQTPWYEGGNATPSPNIFGTTTNDAVDIYTNNTRRGAFTVDGNLDWGSNNFTFSSASAAIGNNNVVDTADATLTIGLTNNMLSAHNSFMVGESSGIISTGGVGGSTGDVIIGFSNGITNSVNSCVIGETSGMNGASASLTVGAGNSIAGGNSLCAGYANTVASGSSNCVVLGSNNAVSGGGSILAFGDHITNTLTSSIAMGFNNRNLTITSGGIGINGSGSSYAPSYAFEVDANAGGMTPGINSGIAFFNLRQVSSHTQLPAVLIDPTTGELFQSNSLYTRGTMSNGSTNEVLSDPAIQKNVKAISNAIEIVNSINPRHFQVDGEKYPSLELQDGKGTYGLNAQEVEKVLPSLIGDTYVPNNSNQETVKTVNYNELLPILIQAVKEQQKRIDDLTIALNKQQESLAVVSISLSEKDQILLLQNNPNPCDKACSIGFNIPTTVQTATIKFSTVDGKTVASYSITERGKGVMNITTTELSAGIYSYSLFADGQLIDTKKMVITK